MPTFRKKPVVIEAEQYTEYGKLVKGMCNSLSCYSSGNTEPHVHTIHDGQIVLLAVGDYVIPEPDGEHYYPCKPDIFEKTYDSAGAGMKCTAYQAQAGMAWSDMAASAYRAYAASTGNKNFRGDPMPTWEQLPRPIQIAWEAASRQVGSCVEGGYAAPLDEGRWNGWLPPGEADANPSSGVGV